MKWLIAFLTVLLVLDCLFLMLLVLVQLPKKEAGLGQAFGSATTDALFGAGSGNALTKMTKYSAGVFFILTLSLSILNAQHSKAGKTRLEEQMQKVSKVEQETAKGAKQAQVPVTAASTVSTSVLSKAASAAVTNLLLTPAAASNAAPKPTNAPPAPSTEKPK
jgi:preprotein translocase subunit SecG